MYVIYAIYNKDHGKIYIGQTRNLDQRLKLHKDKSFRNSYTAAFNGNWKLVYYETVNSRQTALKREKQLKSYKGRQFIKTFT